MNDKAKDLNPDPITGEAGAHPVGEVLGNRVVERPVNGVLGGDLGDHVGVGGLVCECVGM